jgi:type 1 glutamine amidotransferase
LRENGPASSSRLVIESFANHTDGMINRLSKLAARAALLMVLTGTIAGQEAAAPGVGKRVVMMIGEDEYQTWETLPAFAERELKPRGYAVRIVHQDPADKHSFPGLIEALNDADLLVVSVRRRSPPREQLAAVRRHLEAGKALIGIRTASHAFTVRGADQDELAKHPERSEWTEFDREVLGGNYSGHHGAGPITLVLPAPGAIQHPIQEGLAAGGWTSLASLYRTAPLAPDAQTLWLGKIPDQPPQPVAWTRLHGQRQARIFYTSLGHESDFGNADFRQLLVNAMKWALAGR